MAEINSPLVTWVTSAAHECPSLLGHAGSWLLWSHFWVSLLTQMWIWRDRGENFHGRKLTGGLVFFLTFWSPCGFCLAGAMGERNRWTYSYLLFICFSTTCIIVSCQLSNIISHFLLHYSFSFCFSCWFLLPAFFDWSRKGIAHVLRWPFWESIPLYLAF